MATYTFCGNEMLSLYLCKSCHSVLGEGMSLCGHNENLTVIAFLRVTSDVNMSDTLEFGIDDDLEGCYLIESKTIIEGTQLQFDFTQFINGIRELKESLVRMYSRVDTLICKAKTPKQP
ncbi:protein Mis18-beta isoform X2 [Aquarana catesbeiana]|uniref:protein Mis18-beta isoform X2 n=1 Tax=Aquarana catesbeiana TaxID=8400 RepID=UPI003CC941A4